MLSKNKRVLLIDDDPGTLRTLQATFERAGYSTIPLGDPHQAIHLLEQSQPRVIVLDIAMPGMSGWQLLQEIRRQPKTMAIPVILLSVISDPCYRVQGWHAGANDYVVKPFDPDELVARTEAWISEQIVSCRRSTTPGRAEGSRGAISPRPSV